MKRRAITIAMPLRSKHETAEARVSSRDTFDHGDELVDALAVATREVDEIAGFGEDCAALGCARD